jgi:hypothetical protein
MKTIDEIIQATKAEVAALRHRIDGNKMRILRIEADIAKDEGIIEGKMDMVDTLQKTEDDDTEV